MLFSESLKKQEDFRRVYRTGMSRADKYYVMYVWENGLDRNRLGISASKKVGNSVVRHRISRLVRESYRLNEARFRRGIDIVMVARTQAAGLGYAQTERSLLHLAGIQHILNAE